MRAYFEQAIYQTDEGTWGLIGDQLDLRQPGLQVVQVLTLTPSTPYAGQTVTARIQSEYGRAHALPRLFDHNGAGSGLADLTCPRDVDSRAPIQLFCTLASTPTRISAHSPTRERATLRNPILRTSMVGGCPSAMAILCLLPSVGALR